MSECIRVRGARQHNLKGIDVEIERDRFVAITGPSGSGKSSLAFDTIYAEGQRRYVESLSTYAKQFLERMPKPAVDAVEGVSPSVAIDQRNAIQSSRSTVGTVTEVYDYLRLLWARVGTTVCPNCGTPVIPDTVRSATDRLLAEAQGLRAIVAFRLPLSREITHAMAVSNLRSQGYVRVLADGEEVYLPDLEVEAGAVEEGTDRPPDPENGVDLTAAEDLLVIVDRIRVGEEDRERLADALAAAFAEGHGAAVVLVFDGSGDEPRRLPFDESFRCAACRRSFPEPVPALFSFNSPAGACETCTGFGAVLEYARELIVPEEDRSLADGALDPWTKPRYGKERASVLRFASEAGLDAGAAWRDLPREARDVLVDGGTYEGVRFRGVIPFLRSRERKRYKAYIRVFLRQYQLPRACGTCGGARLDPEALHVRVDGRHIAAAAALRLEELREWLTGDLGLTPFERKVARSIIEELGDRVSFLVDVGLAYLTLDRQARTLSGGEMQRIRLASCLGSRLVGTLYVLDEPTIGLHAYDTDRFVDVLERLCRVGNTVLVVEHEPAVLRRADEVIELGPGAGEQGGEIVFQGPWSRLLEADTGTGQALAGRGKPPRSRSSAAPGDRGWLELDGARMHNLEGVDVRLPLACLTAVSGVSGSGKSTLVRGVLFHALERALGGETSARRHLGENEGGFDDLRGAEALSSVALVDQRPIGRTPRSNPATYIGAFKEIREVFAALPESRARGYAPGYFSFNRAGGRCDRCKGAGEETVEMVFLADVSVPCEVCEGSRYRPEVLEIEYRGHTIRDVLSMTVDRAIRFFIRQDKLGEALWHLQRVGLGYLRLGQPATTLSGGEAQRLKVARELARKGRGKGKRGGRGTGEKRLYILDEPTVGLGVGEVRTLVGVLRQLVNEGHTVLVVEHDLEVIAASDWVVDLGPGAADAGGRLVAQGPPDEIAGCAESRTGAYLRERTTSIRGAAAVAGGS